jgi:short-subunit dehydrogenase
VSTHYCLVTGASSGIGRDIARVLAAEKRNLILVARDGMRLEALAAELRGGAILVEVIPADLTLHEAADTLVATIFQRGLAVAVLVNNAGFGVFGNHTVTALADEQQMLDLNVTALTRLTKLLLPAMLARGEGRILNLASIAAFLPGPHMAVYYATKAYVLSYSQALAEELRGSGVTVTALCPGLTESGFIARAGMQSSALVKGKPLPTSHEVAAFGVAAMHRGRRVAIHGWRNRLLASALRLMPRALVTRAVARLSRPQ